MASYNVEAPFTDYRGKICKHAKIIHKKMGSTRFTSQICNPRTKPFTAAELARQAKFRQAAQATHAVLIDATERAAAETAFKAQDKYRYLWGYIFAREYAKL